MYVTPFTLKREDGDPRCDKCEALVDLALKERRATPRIQPATYTLRGQGKVWRVCTPHAAAAAHTLGIADRVFTPHLLTKEHV